MTCLIVWIGRGSQTAEAANPSFKVTEHVKSVVVKKIFNNNNNNKDICKAPNAKASKRIKRTIKYTKSERYNYK